MKNQIKNIFLSAILVFVVVITLSSNAYAKVFVIQNESVNMFVVNDTLALFIGMFITFGFFLTKWKCKGRVAQWREPLFDSRGDASSRMIRKSRRAHTDSTSTNQKKEENQAHSLKKALVRLTRILHKFNLISENSRNPHTVEVKEQSNYLNLSFLNKKIIQLFAILFVLMLPILSLSTQAKVFTIQNESVNMFVVNGSSGNILLASRVIFL